MPQDDLFKTLVDRHSGNATGQWGFSNPASHAAPATANPFENSSPSTSPQFNHSGNGNNSALPYTAADIPAMQQSMPFLGQNRRWSEWAPDQQQAFLNYFTNSIQSPQSR